MSDAIAALSEEFNALKATNSELTESLSQVQQMLAYEDRGWLSLFGGDRIERGLDLDQLKDTAAKIAELSVGNPLLKRAIALRTSYVFSKGYQIEGYDPAKTTRGRPSALDNFCRNPINQRYLLSSEANEEMERSAATEGVYLLLGKNSDKTVRAFPIAEVTGIYTNPDFAGEIWAYQRSWDSLDEQGKSVPKKFWYYVDTYTGPRASSIGPKNEPVPVDDTHTVLDLHFNTHSSWPLGIPDALPAVPWVRTYSELMTSGKKMTDALATFAFKVTTQSKAGAQNLGATLSKNRAGTTAAVGTGNDLVPLSSAGKGYDFGSFRPVASMVATAMEVSVVHLLSDPGAAGSSYGSASTLDLPTQRAMVARQNAWSSFMERVIRWATSETHRVSFPSLHEPDPYREMQVAALAWNSGLAHEDEARPRMLEIASMTPRHDSAPEGVLVPNNSDSLARNDLDTDATPTTAASPDQGQSNGTGGRGTSDNDERTDVISQSLREMKNDEFLERFESLVVRMENASK